MNNKKIAVIGLGYVGLPLAVEFSKKYSVVGYDINISRINDLLNSVDRTLEVPARELKKVINKDKQEMGLYLTNKPKEIQDCNVKIVTVPTPIDKKKKPILKPLEVSSKTVGKYLNKNDIVIYESTVYPGMTEDFCIPILENESCLKFNTDFFVGYSPERINPGDKKRTVDKIIKITSGSNEKSSFEIDNLYKSIIKAGTYRAPSIKVAEAAKVIENTQRDVNIAFVNELSQIFNLMDIDTNEVLKAAGTKWNFLNFKPGLVGGHCIGVDPYYLSEKAIQLGYYPKIILSGREINDSMGFYVANLVIDKMKNLQIELQNSEVLILGATFKENCPDLRNSKVIDVYNTLVKNDIHVSIYDPWADPKELREKYKSSFVKVLKNKKFDAIILCVSHSQFSKLRFNELKKSKSFLFDVKSFLGNNSDYKL